jgi:hypothetical protein
MARPPMFAKTFVTMVCAHADDVREVEGRSEAQLPYRNRGRIPWRLASAGVRSPQILPDALHTFPQTRNLLHFTAPMPSRSTQANSITNMQVTKTQAQNQTVATNPDSDQSQRLFQCSTCKRSFTRADHLTRHVRARMCVVLH